MVCRYAETDTKVQEENMKLTSEYKRITEQFKDLQTKFKHFELVDTKKCVTSFDCKHVHVSSRLDMLAFVFHICCVPAKQADHFTG